MPAPEFEFYVRALNDPPSMPVKNSLRTTLLACLVLLGLQFLFPVALSATEQRPVCEECTIPFAGFEEDGPGPDGGKDVELSSVHPDHFCWAFYQETGSAFLDGNIDRLGLWLLPVSGLQPSAP